MGRPRLPASRIYSLYVEDPVTGCWVWPRSKKGGYGSVSANGKKNCLVHRLSWELTYGPIPDGLDVLHKCDNRACFRPTHLFLGTDLDNMRDMAAKGRGVFQQHPERHPRRRFTVEQVEEIKRRRCAGELSTRLAEEFGCTPSHVRRLANGERRLHG